MNAEEEIVNQNDGDWPEDFGHENGRYQCRCMFCGLSFIGHKRRVACKKCALSDSGVVKDG